MVDYVASVLHRLSNPKELGMTVEQEHFNVFMASELHEAELQIHLQG